MKNLDYYDEPILSQASAQSTYVSLADVPGGQIAKDEIDGIQEFPGATEIAISGLTQDTFEYFIENYGRRFKAIIFWKCPLVGTLKAMEHLDQVEYIVYFWNQRAEKLWDFSKSKALRGFCYDDFTRMHDISEVADAPVLEDLRFGNRVWTRYILNTLAPIARCTSLKNLSFSAKKLLDRRIEPLAQLMQLERLWFPSNLFSTEQVAWLKAHLPDTVVSPVLHAYRTLARPLEGSGRARDTRIVGKGKPLLSSVEDQARISRYVERFDKMHQWYSANPQASPEDYRKAA